MDIGINPSGSQLAIVCLTLGCCALPALILLVMGRFSGGRLTLIPMALSLLPMIFNEIKLLLGGKKKEEESIPAPVAEIVDRVHQRRANLGSKLKRADREFDAQLSMEQNPTQFDQGTAPSDIEAQRYNIDEALPKDSTNWSRWGVRRRLDSPNRVLRDRRFKRNRGPQDIPDDIQEGLVDEEGNIRAPKGNDLLGPASLPGLRGRGRSEFGSSTNKSLRDRRGRRESWDDEVFGGMFDDDGDGFPDM
jgi:hypothetical protein